MSHNSRSVGHKNPLAKEWGNLSFFGFKFRIILPADWPSKEKAFFM
jgi:hypothetical protein